MLLYMYHPQVLAAALEVWSDNPNSPDSPDSPDSRMGKGQKAPKNKSKNNNPINPTWPLDIAPYKVCVLPLLDKVTLITLK